MTLMIMGMLTFSQNSANIIVQNRTTGQLEEEKMQVYVRLGIRLLYKGAKSRMEGSRGRLAETMLIYNAEVILQLERYSSPCQLNRDGNTMTPTQQRKSCRSSNSIDLMSQRCSNLPNPTVGCLSFTSNNADHD
jgi:chromosome condensin MukBEF MukE localization factor